ncbi:MAG TPA: MarR family winged helix-turn-helix transcriptional regulator [Candidatus Acidoferrales bacterium]|nr:MarR family winged helix-turn-helix transcriptional regulator [Candidatus Acidoferrales bacterium]
MPDRIPSAEDTLGFLLADTSRAFRRTFGPLIVRHGISVGLFPFLRMISEHDGLTFRELSDAVHMRGPTTVDAVKELERLGLVRRKRNAHDARKVNLFLTERGRRAWDAVAPEVIAINNLGAAGLSKEEQGELKRLLRQVRKNMSEAPQPVRSSSSNRRLRAGSQR